MTNRRSFIASVLAAGISAAILPSSLTYRRQWKRTESSVWVLNPAWVNAPYQMYLMRSTGVVSIEAPGSNPDVIGEPVCFDAEGAPIKPLIRMRVLRNVPGEIFPVRFDSDRKQIFP